MARALLGNATTRCNSIQLATQSGMAVCIANSTQIKANGMNRTKMQNRFAIANNVAKQIDVFGAQSIGSFVSLDYDVVQDKFCHSKPIFNVLCYTVVVNELGVFNPAGICGSCLLLSIITKSLLN